MNEIARALLFVFTATIGAIAYELCFEVTSLGGYLPAIILTIGPLVGYAIGTLSREEDILHYPEEKMES